MVSPEGPDDTVDASGEGAARPPASERIELPVYQPRRKTATVFWIALLAAAVVVGLVLWVVLA